MRANSTLKAAAIGLAMALTSPAFASSVRLEAAAHFNGHAAAGYNDVWGYEANGREYALLGVQNGTSVVDVTDLANLKEISFIPSDRSVWKDIKTYKHYAYAVNETGGGLQVIDLSKLPEKAELIYTYDGFTTSHNIYIDTDRALLYVEGTHGAVVRILSLENPERPVEISTFGVECHDVYARGNFVYVSEGGHGTIGVYDTSDPTAPTLAYRFEIPRAGYVHNAWLSDDGGFLMTTEETPGKTIKMWDIRDPQNVVMTSDYLAPGKLAHNTHVKGGFAYVSHYGSGLRIVDVSNPSDVKEAAYFTKTDATPEGFVGAWGAYPFFKSGKVLVSDIESGLFVVEWDGARE